MILFILYLCIFQGESSHPFQSTPVDDSLLTTSVSVTIILQLILKLYLFLYVNEKK